jgi:hypothetical protein
VSVTKNGTPAINVAYSDACDLDNSVAGLEARGYKTYFNGTGPVGTTATWFQGNPAVFASYNGPDTGYVAANYNTVASGDIDNWLVTPVIAGVAVGDQIAFWSQSPLNSTFPDSIMVMYSAAGDSTPSASSWVMLGNFKVNTTGAWQQTAFAVAAAGANARFAIRYKVTDGGPLGTNSDFIGIDQIEVFTPGGGGGPANDECAGAIDINAVFGQAVGVPQLIGPYDNTTATTSALDPSTGWECYGEPDGSGTAPTLENTLWFTFTGDGGKYFIETTDGPGVTNYIDDGDTQMSVYTGSCGAFTPVVCNEDGPSATANEYPAGVTLNTTAGQVYYIMIDGFNFNGALSDGEYLIEVTQLQTIACTDPTVTIGTASANKTFVCDGDTVRFDITGVVTPTVGTISGLGWLISNADISGSADPLNDPSVVAGYAVQNPAPTNSFRLYINDGSLIGAGAIPYGTYYWTPVIFGNAVVATPPGTFITQLSLDPACLTTGTSIAVDVLAPGDPLCNVGIGEGNNTFGISGIHPVPVQNELNFTLSSITSGVVKISVTDNLGREVISESRRLVIGEQKLSYDVAALNGGVYFITVSTSNATSVSKFVKQ